MRNHTNSVTVAPITNFFDEANLAILIIVALIARAISREAFTECRWRPGAKLIAWAFFVAYAVHLAPRINIYDDAPEVVALVIRAGVVTAIAFHAAVLPCAYFTHFCYRFLDDEWRRFCDLGRQLTVEHEARKVVAVPELIPAPTPLREEIVQRTTMQAKLDFDFEREIIETADLDDDEKDAAITEARQRYLQRLRSALQ